MTQLEPAPTPRRSGVGAAPQRKGPIPLPGCEELTEEMTSTIRANQGRGCLLGRQKAFNDLLSRLLSAIDFMRMIYELSAGAGYRLRTCDPVITNNMIVISVWFPDCHHVS